MKDILTWLTDYWWIALLLGWGLKCFIVDIINSSKRDAPVESEDVECE